MDEKSGPSRPKRTRRQLNYGLTDSDIEEHLDWGDSSDDNFDPEDCDISSDDEEEADDRRLITDNAALDLVPLLQSQTSSESLQASEGATSAAEISPSAWCTSGELRHIEFNKQNEFFGSPGSTPISFFNFFFEDDFLTMICEKTNARAVKLFCESTVTENSRITSWKELTVSELRVFLGLLFHMGFIQLPRLQDYWKTNRLLAIPIFGQHMSRNRFLLIMRCLQFRYRE
ncbi:unnamed protein product [Euphydryas editha]|uniref:PiggyBac transposable element-derived protein domain-containing protein n=1 Tax=Euphydryas editha TaxID=104508 RepID=A0AAU9TST0_EUPED|nr:unnamed protein product [Euphydryas editha]